MSQAASHGALEVMHEIRAEQEPIASSRKVAVGLDDNGTSSSTKIRVSHGGKKDALSIQLNRTVRVPDNRDTNDLPPGMGTFPLFKVQKYAHNMPENMAKKGGIFFPMYQREAMWIGFSAMVPFAIKIYVGGVNAISGFPMMENDKTKEKRLKMLNSGKQIQDYMVVPEQDWLDGIASEDGKIRQFVAQPKGSGFSVEAQVTGDEKVGGIQIELIPVKKNLPTEFDVRYQNRDLEVITRTFNLVERNLTAESTWGDVKKLIRDEFDIAVNEQILSDHGSRAAFGQCGTNLLDFSNETKLSDTYFPPKFSTISVTNRPWQRRGAKRYRIIEAGDAFGSAASTLMMTAANMGPVADSAPRENTKTSPEEAMVLEDTPGKRTKKKSSSAATPLKVKEMSLAAGGLIKQTIEADTHPASAWDVEASVMMNLQILDVESFCAVTGQPAPDTPVDAQSYINNGYPFFEIWGEEKSGIKGDFSEVKSVAQIEAERAEAEGKDIEEEQSLPVRVVQLGSFRSTFHPVDVLRKELEGLGLNV
ncbi:integral membrane protein [Colletotrichum tofieldiae]|nr:integral membrane protein [Colletotrichum tofieldiae]GKT81037.1 integral membrane protein [Colletotrichum tofieldiae]